MSSFYIETFGCQMNKGDSQLMELSLKAEGFLLAERIEEADYIIYNTCSVRENAEKRALGQMRTVHGLTKLKKVKIIAAGCMAQRMAKELLDKKIADLVIGPYQAPELGKILKNYEKGNREKNFTSQDIADFADRLSPGLMSVRDEAPWHKWVTITHGCENFCAYCIVPYTRGKLISVPSSKVLEYIKQLNDSGIGEITLLGQNVNQYGQDNGDMSFAELLDSVAQIKTLNRIGFLTSHPKDFSEDIIKTIARHSNISRAIHLPLQSASNHILELMNRQYTIEHYYEIIENLDKYLKEYVLSTDLIVGFPGETESDYMETLEAVKKIRFSEAFMYAYSPRSGTAAAKLKEELTKKEKSDRLSRLIDIQLKINEERLNEEVGREDWFVAERVSKKSSHEISGRTFKNFNLVVPGEKELLGTRTRVKINEVRGATLYGEIIPQGIS